MAAQVRRGEVTLPDEDDQAAKYELADDLLTEAGLRWYEVSNWSRPGHECLAGLVALLALVALTYGGGALLARCAPALLGPSRADRLAAAERRAAELTARNQLARELHDSVGHALSAVTLQASAARRVLESDPDFAREALRAIEETTRGAVGELDTVLGVLRGRGGADDPAARPTLAAALDGLVARTRATGAELTVVITGSVDGADTDTAALEELPAEVSRAAYRMVQEGIGNALRHAEGAAIALRLTLSPRALVLAVENPLTGGASSQMAPRVGGGSGLSGIAERAEQLGGSASAGPEGRLWRLTARLPLAG
jgi:signal transduction histidine kinase